MQRLCKYPLLFRALLEATPADNAARAALEQAAAAVEVHVKQVNDYVQTVEAQRTIHRAARHQKAARRRRASLGSLVGANVFGKAAATDAHAAARGGVLRPGRRASAAACGRAAPSAAAALLRSCGP